jgi:hypothetical protein
VPNFDMPILPASTMSSTASLTLSSSFNSCTARSQCDFLAIAPHDTNASPLIQDGQGKTQGPTSFV